MAEHGTRSCYVMGCRLPECVEANRVYQREFYRANYAKPPGSPRKVRSDKGLPREDLYRVPVTTSRI